jgi:hypothetical protein
VNRIVPTMMKATLQIGNSRRAVNHEVSRLCEVPDAGEEVVCMRCAAHQ